MAGRRRTLSIGPPTRGLTDFPEHATPEHSTQALNVEFCNGGVSTRRGTSMISAAFYQDGGGTARSATVKLVKTFSGNTFGHLTAVGLVPTAGAEQDEERLLVRWQSNFAAAGAPAGSFQLTAPHALTNEEPSSRWDACLFQETNRADPTLVVCTDHWIGNAPSVFRSTLVGGAPAFQGVSGIDRNANPYHGGVVNPSPFADDPGDLAGSWYTGDVRARFCRQSSNRLVLANLRQLPVPVTGQESLLWYSNLGDLRGWCIDNIVPPSGTDPGPVTGLASKHDNVVVFRRSSVSLFRIESGGLYTYRQVISDRGCVAHSTIIDNAMGMVLFLSHDGFYGFDGKTLHHLSEPISRTMREAIQSGDVGGAHAVHYPLKQQVWVSIPASGDAPTRTFVMDYRNGYRGRPAWSIFEYQSGAWSDGGQRKRWGGFASSGWAGELYGVSIATDGKPGYERLDIGSAEDEQGATSLMFRSRWESGPVEYSRTSVNRWRYLRPMIRPTSAANITGWWRRDEQPFSSVVVGTGQSVSFAPDSDSGGAALGAFVLGTDRLGDAEDHHKRLDIHSNGVGRYGRVGFQTEASPGAKSFDIRGVNIDTLELGLNR